MAVVDQTDAQISKAAQPPIAMASTCFWHATQFTEQTMYKTILMYADQFSGFEWRLQVAAELAREDESHLIGTVASGGPQLDYIVYGAMTLAAPPTMDYELLRQAAQEQLAHFDDRCRQLGIGSYEARFQDTSAVEALILQSLYCDLAIVGQSDLSDRSLIWSTRLPAYLALHIARPLLVIPERDDVVSNFTQSIIIAWNASVEASRAVAGALPLLRRARRVQIVVLNPRQNVGRHGDEPGADLATYLARHGVRAEVLRSETKEECGTALCHLAQENAAELIVAGAFGRSRFQEWVLGGTTRNLLSQSQLPVLLAH